MAASKDGINVYVPAHQIRMRDSGDYLWVKWWSGDNTNYAHLHRPNIGSSFHLYSIGRNGTTIAQKEDANLDDLPNGLLETLQARYEIVEYTEGDR